MFSGLKNDIISQRLSDIPLVNLFIYQDAP